MSEIMATPVIMGSISPIPVLTGSINSSPEFTTYDGSYDITPQINQEQVLKTADKLMTKDVVVSQIPVYEVSNPTTGKTVYIGSEVEINVRSSKQSNRRR